MQLYDLGAEVSEAKNLKFKRTKDVERLSSLLTLFIKKGLNKPGKPQKNNVLVKVTRR